MRKLHDLKIMLSQDAQLSKMDCMKIKGGEADKRKKRPSGEASNSALIGTVGCIETGGLFGGG